MGEKLSEETTQRLDEKTDELLLSLFNALINYDDNYKMDSFEEYLIHQAIMNAYKDATNQGAFNAVFSYILMDLSISSFT